MFTVQRWKRDKSLTRHKHTYEDGNVENQLGPHWQESTAPLSASDRDSKPAFVDPRLSLNSYYIIETSGDMVVVPLICRYTSTKHLDTYLLYGSSS